MARIPAAPLPDELPVHNNLVRATYLNPGIHRGFASLSGRVHSESHLPPRTRELVVLRIAAMLGAAYEWQQHAPAARRAGVTDDEISALRARDLSFFRGADAAALAYVSAVEEGGVDEAVWRLAAAHFSDVELLDLTMLAAFYGLASRVVLALAVDLEES